MGKVYKREVEEVIREITFLYDVLPAYISLCRYGANRAPFKVLKNEGGDDIMLFVQSVMLPKDKTLEALAGVKGLEWLADINPDSVEKFDTYNKFHQVRVDKFDKDSLQVVPLQEKDVFVTLGSLINEDDKTNAITLEINKAEDTPAAVTSLKDRVVIDKPRTGMFGELFQRELNAFLGIMSGALIQKSDPADQRRQIVLSALDNFKAFISSAFDSFREDINKEDFSNFIKMRTPEGNEGGAQVNKEDVKSIVIEVLKEEAANAVQATAPAVQTESVKKEDAFKQKSPDATLPEGTLADILNKLTILSSKVATIVEKQDKYDYSLATPIPPGTPGVPVVSEKKSVFSGLLVKRNS